jgi:hypothetical protein
VSFSTRRNQNRNSPTALAAFTCKEKARIERAERAHGGALIAILRCVEQVNSALRYIAAEHVDTPLGRLDGTVLVGPSDETVGALDGMIIDPIERHVRYFVVRSRNWLKTRLQLVPAAPARLDSEHKTLHVDISAADLPQLAEIRSDTFPRYSDDDLIAAMFSTHAA